jgi:hypothetical protein
MTTDADPKAPTQHARVEQLEDRASRLTGAVWFMLDTQLAMVEQLGAKMGDAAAFRKSLYTVLSEIRRADEPQLSARAKATYAELLTRLKEGPAPKTPYISAEVERAKLPQ